MTDVPRDERYRAYWEAIRRRVCSVCLDCGNEGNCGLTGARACAIEVHLPVLVEALSSVRSGRMDEYLAAVEARICPACPEQDPRGHCGLRQRGECALSLYMPLVLDAIEEVDGTC